MRGTNFYSLYRIVTFSPSSVIDPGIDLWFIVTPICNCSMFCCTLFYVHSKKTPAIKFLDQIFRNNFFIFNFSKMCSR